MKFKTVEEATAHAQGLIDKSPFKGTVKPVAYEFEGAMYLYMVPTRPRGFYNRLWTYSQVWGDLLACIHAMEAPCPA